MSKKTTKGSKAATTQMSTEDLGALGAWELITLVSEDGSTCETSVQVALGYDSAISHAHDEFWNYSTEGAWYTR